MYQLNYHSKATPGLKLQDLQDIHNEAMTANQTNNISGCLIYHNNSFVQILEGNEEDVLQIYQKISGDKRHHTVTMLWEGAIEKRYFTEWNMAYHQPDTDSIKSFVNNLLLLSQLSDKSTASLLSFWASVRKILGDGTTREKYSV